MAGPGILERSGYPSLALPTSAVTPAQIVPQFIFSGITERFPGLVSVFPEAGVGSLNYVIAACDHEWESRHLWTEGVITRPSEIVRRQMYVNFWFEAEGIKLRDDIGVDNIMWESDFPHVASYYPHSWREVERVLKGDKTTITQTASIFDMLARPGQRPTKASYRALSNMEIRYVLTSSICSTN